MIRETLGVSAIVVRDWDLRKVSDYVLIRINILYETEVMILFQIRRRRVLGDISVGNIDYKCEWKVIRR